ncbi:MAG: class I SAM-dependent methyltransferase [Chitinophagaceae bacterium]
MRIPEYSDSWLRSWKESYHYDLLEVGNTNINKGYQYAYEQRFNTIVGFVEKYIPVGGVVLDIAAAQGNFTLKLAEKGYTVYWNDLREELIDYVKLKWEFGSVDFIAGNIFELEQQLQVDGVLITEIIEHVAHPDVFLKRVSSFVKPGGFIFMSTPLGSYFLNKLPRFSDCIDPSVYEAKQFMPNADGHIFLLHQDEISIISQKAGLRLVDEKMYSNFLTSGHFGTHGLLKLLPKSLISRFESFTQNLGISIRRKIHSNISVVLHKTA